MPFREKPPLEAMCGNPSCDFLPGTGIEWEC